MPLQGPGTYSELQPLGFEGSPGDLAPSGITTAVNESEAMPYGRVVAYDSTGTNDRSCKLTDNAADVLLGITQRTHFDESFDLSTGVAQVSTVTVGGTAADGLYRIPLSLDGGNSFINADVTRAGTPASNNDLATALRLAINSDPTLSLELTAGGAGADVVITKNSPGSFALGTLVAPGTGTLTGALTTGGEADGYKQNEEANVKRMGVVTVRPEDPVTPASGVFVRITANAGVGTALGALRGTADGVNTRDISSVARWVTSSQGGASGGLAKLMINLPNV